MVMSVLRRSFGACFLSTLLFLIIGAESPIWSQVSKRHSDDEIQLSQPLIRRWRYDSVLTLNLTPAFDRSTIYVPLAGGTLIALNASDGKLRWKTEIGGELSASPIADDQHVYVASEIIGSEGANVAPRTATGTLRAVGKEGGVTRWMRTLARPLRGGLTLANDRLLAGSSDGRVYSFSRNNGEANWGYQHSAAINSQPVVFE